MLLALSLPSILSFALAVLAIASLPIWRGHPSFFVPAIAARERVTGVELLAVDRDFAVHAHQAGFAARDPVTVEHMPTGAELALEDAHLVCVCLRVSGT